MADARNPNPTSATTDQPNKARTGTPSNVPQTASPGGPSSEEVSRRAYELFQKRGGQHGYHMEDWYEAERQLRQEHQAGGPSRDGSAPAATTAKKSAAKKSTAKKSAAKKSAAKKTGGQG